MKGWWRSVSGLAVKQGETLDLHWDATRTSDQIRAIFIAPRPSRFLFRAVFVSGGCVQTTGFGLGAIKDTHYRISEQRSLAMKFGLQQPAVDL